MSIEKTNIVDAVYVDSQTEEVILMITDHLEWNDLSGEHLLLLQEKINGYLRFIESGELVKTYPKALGRQVVIDVVGKYPLNDEAERFYELAAPTIEAAGIRLRFQLSDDTQIEQNGVGKNQ
jgi:hypothetical protein